MAGRIYLLNNQAELVAMAEAPYDSEKLLQELLAKHPDLLAGEQINSEQPRRWLLVTREMAVPGEEEGAGRWSLDHLFLDQDAIPTLIEVKRSTDSRIRREVVGQMLDYAANAVAYWPVEEIKAKFEGRCEADGSDPSEELAELLGEDHDTGDFWQLVKTNLQAGRVRLVFVADDIPPELRRVVEFLNGQMDPAEVLAIEIRQFVGQDVKTLVPRVLGQTESARKKKGSTSDSSQRVAISETEFLEGVSAEWSAEESQIARDLVAWARGQRLEDNFKRGGRGVAFIPVLRGSLGNYSPMSIRRGDLRIRLGVLKWLPPFDADDKRAEVFRRIEKIPGLVATELAREGYPKIPLSQLTDKAAWKQLTDTLDWIVTEIRLVQPSP
jgi:hypothetical protein